LLKQAVISVGKHRSMSLSAKAIANSQQVPALQFCCATIQWKDGCQAFGRRPKKDIGSGDGLAKRARIAVEPLRLPSLATLTKG